MRRSVSQILRDKLAHHDFLFAHGRMMFTKGEDAGKHLLKRAILAVTKGDKRFPRGNCCRFQFFSRATSQHEQAAESSLPPIGWYHGIDNIRKLLDFSGEDNKLPDPCVHMHLRAGQGERGGDRCYPQFEPMQIEGLPASLNKIRGPITHVSLQIHALESSKSKGE